MRKIILIFLIVFSKLIFPEDLKELYEKKYCKNPEEKVVIKFNEVDYYLNSADFGQTELLTLDFLPKDKKYPKVEDSILIYVLEAEADFNNYVDSAIAYQKAKSLLSVVDVSKTIENQTDDMVDDVIFVNVFDNNSFEDGKKRVELYFKRMYLDKDNKVVSIVYSHYFKRSDLAKNPKLYKDFMEKNYELIKTKLKELKYSY